MSTFTDFSAPADVARENVRKALAGYKSALKTQLESTSRGSGHADNEFDHLKACITQVDSAARVLWMESGV
jgi:hypothetical protein